MQSVSCFVDLFEPVRAPVDATSMSSFSTSVWTPLDASLVAKVVNYNAAMHVSQHVFNKQNMCSIPCKARDHARGVLSWLHLHLPQ